MKTELRLILKTDRLMESLFYFPVFFDMPWTVILKDLSKKEEGSQPLEIHM